MKTKILQLRFPEFGNQDWTTVTLKSCCTMKAGKFISATEICNKNERGLYPCYGGNGLRGYTKKYNHDGVFSLIGRQGALCGNVTLAAQKFYATEHAIVVTPKEYIDTAWLYYTLSFLNLNQYATGQAQPGLSIESIEKVPFQVPKNKAEQQKIADCLASLDQTIGAETGKLKAYQKHKKWLMQQLFPADGKTVPRLRFPEFRNAPEWEEKTLSEFAFLYKGKGVSKADIIPNGKIPCIRYGELYTAYNEIIDTVFSATNLPLSELFFSKKNDVLLPSSGETKEDISTASCVMLDNIALGGDLNVIRTEQDGRFISYYFNSAKKREIAKIAQGDTVVHLYSNQLKQLKISLPELSEQQKIADCLSSLDELIAAQTQKIERLKIFKKGLMQQLFPANDEANASAARI